MVMTAAPRTPRPLRRPEQPAVGTWPGLAGELYVWTAVTAIAITALSGVIGFADARTLMVAGVIEIAFGMRVFLRHGKTRITPAGVYSLGFAVLVGATSIMLPGQQDPSVNAKWLMIASLVAFYQQVAVVALAGHHWPAVSPAVLLSEGVRHGALAGGVALLVIAYAFRSSTTNQYSQDIKGLVVEGIAVSAALMIIAALAANARTARQRFFVLLITAALLGLYTFVFHQGGGRIRVLVLAVAVAVLLGQLQPSWRIKPAVLFASPLAIVLLVVERVAFIRQLKGTAANTNGLDSIFAALHGYAVLLHGLFEHSYRLRLGSTFVTPVTSWLRDWWLPHAPEPFGIQIVSITHPTLVGTGFSDYAMFSGEFIFNIGLAGIVLYAVVTALVLRGTDRMLSTWRRSAPEIPSVRAVSRLGPLLLSSIVCGGLLELQWGGLNLFVNRTLTRLPVVLAVYLVGAAGAAAGRRKPQPGARRRGVR